MRTSFALCSAVLTLALSCSDDGASESTEPTPPPVIACTTSAVVPGDTRVTLEHGGQTRSYLLHVPPSYDGTKQVPLVVDMHGLGSNAMQQRSISGWLAKSDAEGFVLAQPNGLNSSWNGGSQCCGSSQADQVDDEGFLRAAVAQLKTTACVDARRVYATGLSNGGAMTYVLGCRASDVFAAIAPGAMGNGSVPCEPSRPVPIAMWRATADQLVPYEGGTVTSYTFPSAQADFDQWKSIDGCTGEPKTTDGICKTYTKCAGDSEVTLCTVASTSSDLLGGHILYPLAIQQAAALPDVAWRMFSRHTLP